MDLELQTMHNKCIDFLEEQEEGLYGNCMGHNTSQSYNCTDTGSIVAWACEVTEQQAEDYVAFHCNYFDASENLSR
jgi:hypothetical protein